MLNRQEWPYKHKVRMHNKFTRDRPQVNTNRTRYKPKWPIRQNSPRSNKSLTCETKEKFVTKGFLFFFRKDKSNRFERGEGSHKDTSINIRQSGLSSTTTYVPQDSQSVTCVSLGSTVNQSAETKRNNNVVTENFETTYSRKETSVLLKRIYGDGKVCDRERYESRITDILSVTGQVGTLQSLSKNHNSTPCLHTGRGRSWNEDR